MNKLFDNATNFIRDYVLKLDKEQILGIDKEEIKEDIENEFFGIIANRISDEQASELQTLDTEGKESELELYIVQNIPYYESYLKDAVQQTIKFYQEDFVEALQEETT